MAEQIDLSINIGANTQDLQAELQKAQNLLAQFQSALKKATNVGEINYLNTAISNLQQKIAGLNSQMSNIKKPSADATNALSNLSRVAQDAPYGFIGIANNLNPLLESFQRLQKESGSGANALKSLVSGLTGPAGIGLALGVASSLIVKFGDDIQKFISEKAVGLGKAFTKESELITSGTDAFVKARLQIVDLNNEFNNYTNGVITKEAFLKKFNDTLGDTIKETKDLAVAEKFLTDYADDYVQMTFKKAVANEAAAQAAKKQLEAETTRAKPSEAFKGVGDFTTLFFGGNLESISKVAKNRQNTIATNAENDVKLLESIRLKYQKQADGIQAELSKVFGKPNVKGAKTNNEFTTGIQNEIKAIELEAFKAKQMRDKLKDINKPFLMEKPEDKAKAEKQRLAGIKAFGESKMTGDLGKSLQGATSTFYEETLKDNQARAASIQLTKQQTEANLQLADTLSNYASDAFMNLWASMEQGMSIGEALGNLFMDLAKQIAAAAIKAAVFQAILAAVSGGGSAAATATSGGFMNLFKGFLGLASGGVVTKPTLAMVGEGNESEAVMPLSKLSGMLNTTFNAGAMSSTGSNGGQFVLKGNDLVLALQRSNTNLNLRRGV